MGSPAGRLLRGNPVGPGESQVNLGTGVAAVETGRRAGRGDSQPVQAADLNKCNTSSQCFAAALNQIKR